MSLNENPPHEIEAAIESVTPPSPAEKPKASLTGRVFKAVEQTGAAVGNVVEQSGAMVGNMVGQALPTLGNVADKTSRLTGLKGLFDILPNPFAAKVRNGEVAARPPSELAEAFAVWLRQKHKGQIEIERQLDNQQVLVKLKAAGLLGGRYLFAFAPSAETDFTASLFGIELQGHKYSALAALAIEWPAKRSNLEDKLSLFIWRDGVRLGEDNAASDYIAAWLADYTGWQFEKKDLLENASKGRKGNYIRSFIGRDEIVQLIGRSITTNWEIEDGLPWIFSIWGQGGSGKSYLLQRVQQLYGARMLYAQIDHQNPEESEENLLRLINGLAVRLQEAGCPTPHHDKTNTQLVAARNRAAGLPEQSALQEVGNIASKGFSIASKLASSAERLTRMFDIAGALTDVGLGIFDRISKQRQEKIDAVLTSRPIQDLTAALVQDLAIYVARQRKNYYLWRRPVLGFDTYELIGPLADQWLRTLLLPAVQDLRPIILIAGRYELLRFNTRWAEFQDGMRVIKLDSFSQEEAERYLTTLGVSQDNRNAALYEISGGVPLFLSSIANLSSEELAIKALAGRILEEVEPEWHNLFLDMVLPDGFNLDTVRRVVADEQDAAAAFSRLTQATFVEGRGGLWHYVPAVRHILQRYAELISPVRVALVKERFN